MTVSAGAAADVPRLDFRVPGFVRTLWTSDSARNTWAQRIERIQRCWPEIERRSVSAGVRRCALQLVSPSDFVDLAAKLSAENLHFVPVGINGVAAPPSDNVFAPYRAGEPFLFLAVVASRSQDVVAFKAAFDRKDHAELGAMLGYPPCCAAFFEIYWCDKGFSDTTWFAALNTTAAVQESCTCEVRGPPQANILWRWLQVRAVPHLPCRFDCAETTRLANDMLAVGEKSGYVEETGWLQEILSWPAEWSMLHGIAEIRTPILKISTATDATAHRYVVRRHSDTFPKEGARGLMFPYHRPNSNRVRASLPPRKGGARPKAEPFPQRPDWYHVDNGFVSQIAMQRAQQPILDLVLATLGDDAATVLDLGCGNGALLQQICKANQKVSPFGIDIEPGKIAHARELFPACPEQFVAADFFDAQHIWKNDPYSLVLLMPGRLLDARGARAQKLKDQLRTNARHLLVYAYDDWLERFGDLTTLSERAGLRLLSADPPVRASLARVV